MPPPGRQRQRLGEILIRRGLINRDQLAQGLAVQELSGGRLGEILVRLGYISASELNSSLNEQWRLVLAAATIAVGTWTAFAGTPSPRASWSEQRAGTVAASVRSTAPIRDGRVAGTVIETQGKAFAVDTYGARREVAAGDQLKQGDVLETSGSGWVAVTLADGSALTVGADATLVLDHFVYNPERSLAGALSQGVKTALGLAAAVTTAPHETIRGERAVTIGIRG